MTKRKALVIAEADTLGLVISTVLKREEFEVTVVDPLGSGSMKELDEAISTTKYDLILPTNNGLTPDKILELIPEIREKDREVKIIVLSGYRPGHFVKELEKKDINGFLSIPFRPEELIGRVKELLPR